MTEQDTLDTVTSFFQDSTDWDKTWREEAKVNYSYYYGEQWSSDEIAALEERGQSAGVYNHIKPAIDSIIGGERKNRPKIMMAPRDPSDADVAEAKTNLYQYIEYNSRTDDELDEAIKDALVTGRGWMHVYPAMDGQKFDDIMHRWIDYRDMFSDPLSKRKDMADARYLHQAVFTDEDIIKASFPDFKAYVGEGEHGFVSSSDDDLWFENKNRKRPRLINTWFRDENGTIHSAIWVMGQLLSLEESPYNFNRFPYSHFTLDTDLDNFPVGYVKTMRSPQDEVNKRHSKALHYLNSKQVWAEETAFKDIADAKKTLAKPDGITLFVDDALREGRAIAVDNVQLAATHIQLMEQSKREILGLVGLNPAYMGQEGNYDSGDKNQQNIQQAQNVLAPMLNRLRISRYDVAYMTMKMSIDYYVEERLIRILEANRSYSFMPINGTKLLDDGTIADVNNMMVDDVDIIIEDSPASLNEEEQQLRILLQIQGQTGQPIPPEILLRYTKLRDRFSLSNELKDYNNIRGQLEQAQGMIQQQQEQMKLMEGQLKVQQNNLVQIEASRQVQAEVEKMKDDIGL